MIEQKQQQLELANCEDGMRYLLQVCLRGTTLLLS
jgi:hypothetical protein